MNNETMPTLQPAIFFGHGSPMNAIQNNRYSAVWKRIGESFPKPRAVLMVSAHWYIPATAVTINNSPRTIHDFGGFPDELFRVQYPAPGDPSLAQRVQELISTTVVSGDNSWGLDHGTWSVLRHVYPNADVPVVQLSIDVSKPARFHYDIGRALAPLRAEGILIAGSGNVVHNLRQYDWSGARPQAHAWATRFEQQTKESINNDDHESLIQYEKLGMDAKLSIPTAEHFLPMLYVLGSKMPSDKVHYPVDGIEGGSLSMLTVTLGI